LQSGEQCHYQVCFADKSEHFDWMMHAGVLFAGRAEGNVHLCMLPMEHFTQNVYMLQSFQ
jgi:hypothetical protein